MIVPGMVSPSLIGALHRHVLIVLRHRVDLEHCPEVLKAVHSVQFMERGELGPEHRVDHRVDAGGVYLLGAPLAGVEVGDAAGTKKPNVSFSTSPFSHSRVVTSSMSCSTSERVTLGSTIVTHSISSFASLRPRRDGIR